MQARHQNATNRNLTQERKVEMTAEKQLTHRIPGKPWEVMVTIPALNWCEHDTARNESEAEACLASLKAEARAYIQQHNAA